MRKGTWRERGREREREGGVGEGKSKDRGRCIRESREWCIDSALAASLFSMMDILAQTHTCLIRYLQPPSYWVACGLESRELLSICLKRLKGLSKVHLVDAGFIWTEPHSKRVKVKLTIQKEVSL